MTRSTTSAQLRKVSALARDPENARSHSDEQIGQIVASIRRFGFVGAIATVGDTVYAGNGRHEAVERLYAEGETVYAAPGRERGGEPLPAGTIPAFDCSGWSEDERRAFALADNRIAENATWNEDILRSHMAALVEIDFDVGVIGFSRSDVLEIIAPALPTGDPDAIPPQPDNPVSRLGDIWVLGPHRIICGSSTDPEAVARLLDGEQPNLMVTDPPYGVEYDANWRNEAPRSVNPGVGRKRKTGEKVGGRAIGKVMNDDQCDWTPAWELFEGDVAYVWHAGTRAGPVAASLAATGLEVRAQIIWSKNQLVIGRGDYHPQHEPCWYVVRKGRPGKFRGGRKQTTVWQIDKPRASETGHSTQKPVECMKRPIENNSDRGDAVYEPFCGSGTTIVAAHLTGRRCFAVELFEPYVDMCVRRWETLTGEKAVLLGGRTFAEVADERGVVIEVPATSEPAPVPADDLVRIPDSAPVMIA